MGLRIVNSTFVSLNNIRKDRMGNLLDSNVRSACRVWPMQSSLAPEISVFLSFYISHFLLFFCFILLCFTLHLLALYYFMCLQQSVDPSQFRSTLGAFFWSSSGLWE